MFCDTDDNNMNLYGRRNLRSLIRLFHSHYHQNICICAVYRLLTSIVLMVTSCTTRSSDHFEDVYRGIAAASEAAAIPRYTSSKWSELLAVQLVTMRTIEVRSRYTAQMQMFWW